MTIVIAGDRSNVGKTTVTLAILAWLKKQKLRVQSFKVGPDYIDPMFHTAITRRPCRNLDPVLTSEDYVKSCWVRHSVGVDAVVVEGVMGLFDGVSLPNSNEPPHFASTAHVAKLIDAPVVLVLNCAGVSASIAAITAGFRNFDPHLNLAGVILNRVASERHLTLLQNALEPLSIPILGVLYRHSDITLPQRHLGLVPSEEIVELQSLIDRLATLAADSFNWKLLLPLLSPSPYPPIPPSPYPPIPPNEIIKIGIARDRAFSFYYQDNLDLLQTWGAEIIPFSPLEDRCLPPVDGIYLGGGFPEMFAAELSDNRLFMEQIKQAIASGTPVYAECGGLMYLSQSITAFDDYCWPQLGILPTAAVMSAKLTLGYRRAIGTEHNCLIAAQTIWGHEFHRSCLTKTSTRPLWQLQTLSSDNRTAEGWQQKQIYASYLHLHWGENQIMVKNWLNTCRLAQNRLD